MGDGRHLRDAVGTEGVPSRNTYGRLLSPISRLDVAFLDHETYSQP